MPLIYTPLLCPENIGITLLQLLQVGGGANELWGTNAGYSKFADKSKGFKLPSRVAMVQLYSPALLVSLRYLWRSQDATALAMNGREGVTAALLSFHFGKRVLESLFLHRYSGTMDGDVLIPISIFYALTAAIIAQQQTSIGAYEDSTGSRIMLGFGLVCSAVGQLGNFYHHWLLAKLRRPAKAKENGQGDTDGQTKAYVVPQGGLFKYVTMPHYFFELVAWFGLACATQHFNAFVTFGHMSAYLAGRSVATTRWYRKKMPDYPPERKHLVPLIF